MRKKCRPTPTYTIGNEGWKKKKRNMPLSYPTKFSNRDTTASGSSPKMTVHSLSNGRDSPQIWRCGNARVFLKPSLSRKENKNIQVFTAITTTPLLFALGQKPFRHSSKTFSTKGEKTYSTKGKRFMTRLSDNRSMAIVT